MVDMVMAGADQGWSTGWIERTEPIAVACGIEDDFRVCCSSPEIPTCLWDLCELCDVYDLWDLWDLYDLCDLCDLWDIWVLWDLCDLLVRRFHRRRFICAYRKGREGDKDNIC